MFIEKANVSVTDVVTVSTPDGEWIVPYSITPDGLIPDLSSLPGAVGAEVILALMERGTVISGLLSEGQWDYWLTYYACFVPYCGEERGVDVLYDQTKHLTVMAHPGAVGKNWSNLRDFYHSIPIYPEV